MAVQQQAVDLLVVGGGMVGLATAIAAAQVGFRVEVLEKNDWPTECPASPQARVSALTRASENFLRTLGVWELIPPSRRGAYRHMRVWQDTPALNIAFSARDLAEPNLGHIVENEVLRWALCQVAKEVGVRLRSRQHIEGIVNDVDRVLVKDADGGEIAAKVLVATDGGNSRVRQALGIITEQKPYHQTAFVALVEAEKGFGRCAWQRFLPTGPLAFLPLTGESGAARRGALASIVWTVDDDEAAQRSTWQPEDWCAALESASQNEFGKLCLRSRVSAFPLVSRHAVRYREGRVVLAGDAAHTIHPLAGQGVNLGFSDAESLVRWLAKGLQNGHGDICRYLQAYESERRGVNQKTRQAMTAIGRLFKMPSFVLEPGLVMLQRMPFARRSMARMALYGE